MEIQQSPLYQQYIKSLHWHGISVDSSIIYYRYIPFFGVLAKLQRPNHLPYIPKLVMALKTINAKQISVEAAHTTSQEEFSLYIHTLSRFIPIMHAPFLPTKTILIDCSSSQDILFSRFTSAKRRAVRKAEKNGVSIIQSHSINDLIGIKSKGAGLFGQITTHGIDRLWNILYPSNATILLAKNSKDHIIAGILLLFWEKTALYWIAGATHEGKKLFAPTLLVWHALKEAKKRKCSSFDFIGVWDERMPSQFSEWKGFTKFKEGFGGTPIYYPISKPHKAI